MSRSCTSLKTVTAATAAGRHTPISILGYVLLVCLLLSLVVFCLLVSLY
jgi:hypothetical protein